MTKLTDADREYKTLMKKVDRVIEKADQIGYEFSDLESGIISRISIAESMDYVDSGMFKAFNHIYEIVMKRKGEWTR